MAGGRFYICVICDDAWAICHSFGTFFFTKKTRMLWVKWVITPLSRKIRPNLSSIFFFLMLWTLFFLSIRPKTAIKNDGWFLSPADEVTRIAEYWRKIGCCFPDNLRWNIIYIFVHYDHKIPVLLSCNKNNEKVPFFALNDLIIRQTKFVNMTYFFMLFHRKKTLVLLYLMRCIFA